MYVDYAGEKLTMVDPATGELIDLEVFVSVLGGSQLLYMEAAMRQKTEDFITTCEHTLYYYGGSPLAIVPDNLKAAVVRSNRYEPVLNDASRDFASHYTMAVVPAGPYKPTHKALVEGAVKIVYRAIYLKIRQGVFSSLESINKAIREAVEEFTNRPLSGRPYSRRIERQLRNARFRYRANLEQTYFDIDRNLDKNLFMRLTECTYIDRFENVMITGSTGIGYIKQMIMYSRIRKALHYNNALPFYFTLFFHFH
jgi:hypothetical protein